MNKEVNLNNKKKKFGIRSLLALSTIFTMLFCTVAIDPGISRAAAASTLSFNEGTTTSVTNGDSFTLTPTIVTGANHVSIVALRITFDASKLAVDSITPSSTFGTVESAAAISNTNGTATIDLSVGNANPSVTGTYDVATLTLHAIATGSASVAFTGAAGTSGAAADGETGNVVISTTPITVTVAAAAEPEEPGDTTAPVISNGTPSGELSRGTTTSTISVTTNENATCKYSTSSGVAYASMTGTFTTTGTTTHSFAGTGFSNGNGYRYYVRCQDSATNVNASDYTISFSIDKSSSKKKEVKKKKRKIYNSQKKLRQGEVLVQRGKRFSKNSTVMLYFSKYGGGYYAPVTIKTSGSGTFSVSYRINKPRGTYSWYALDVKTGKKSKIKTYRVR